MRTIEPEAIFFCIIFKIWCFNGSIKRNTLIRSRIIGKAGECDLKDGNFEQARFNHPTSICFLSNKPIAFVCERDNHIRMVDFETEKVFTVVGSKASSEEFRDGNSQYSVFCGPRGITIHKNQKMLYVSDKFSHVIRRVDISSIQQNQKLPLDGEFNFEVSTICGSPRVLGFADGIGDEAKLNEPSVWPPSMYINAYFDITGFT